MLCEIKFSTSAYILDKKTADNIRQKHAVFKYHSQSNKHLFTTFITTFELVDNKWTAELIDQQLTMHDLFT